METKKVLMYLSQVISYWGQWVAVGGIPVKVDIFNCSWLKIMGKREGKKTQHNNTECLHFSCIKQIKMSFVFQNTQGLEKYPQKSTWI